MKIIFLFVVVSFVINSVYAQQVFGHNLGFTGSLSSFSINNKKDQFRSASVPKVKNDSVYLGEHRKNIYSYDVNGNLVLDLGYTRVSINDSWKSYSKCIYTYDHNKMVFSSLSFWNSTNLLWQVSSEKHYTYDAKNQLIEQEAYSSFGGVLSPSSKIQFYYNLEGKVDSIVTSSNDSFSNSWTPTGKYVYLYSENNDSVEVIDYKFHSTWVAYSKSINQYNNNVLTKEEILYWDDISKLWIKGNKYDYVYGDNNLLMYTSSSWNDNNYVATDKYLFTYDAFGNKLTFIRQTYNEAELVWNNASKTEYIYNDTFQNSEVMYLGSELINPDLNIFGLYIPLIYYWEFGMGYKNMLTNQKGYNWNSKSSSWVLDDISTLYFSNLTTTSVKESSKKQEKVLLQNGVVLLSDIQSGTHVSIYNLQGINILHKISDSDVLELKLPSHGFYIIKMDEQVFKVQY